MVEPFHRQLKATIMAHESPNPWTTTLPAVLLGVHSAAKELLGRPAAEMIYGTTLRLPGEFTELYTFDARTDLDNYSDKLRVAKSRLRLCPQRDTPQKYIFQYKELETCSHVFLRRIAIPLPLTAPHDGPYKVISRSGRVMTILIKGKMETVSIDCVKPLSASLNQVQTQSVKRNRKQRNQSLLGSLVDLEGTDYDPVALSLPSRSGCRGVRSFPSRGGGGGLSRSNFFKNMGEKSLENFKNLHLKGESGSSETPSPPPVHTPGMGVELNTNTKTSTPKAGTSLAINLQSQATTAHLPRPPTPYKAPHSRTPVDYRASGNGGGLRTYSRVPSHLRGQVINQNNTKKTIQMLEVARLPLTATKSSQIIL